MPGKPSLKPSLHAGMLFQVRDVGCCECTRHLCGPGLRRRGVGIDACCFVEGGRASLNHAHYRGRTTPVRLSVADVAPVLRPHGFSICGFPREGREKIPNHAQWVLNHLRHGGGALSLQHAPFFKLAMPPRTYSRNLLQIFRQALRFEPTWTVPWLPRLRCTACTVKQASINTRS